MERNGRKVRRKVGKGGKVEGTEEGREKEGRERRKNGKERMKSEKEGIRRGGQEGR